MEYVARHDPEAVTHALDELADEIDTKPDRFLAAASKQLLEKSEW